MSIEHTTYKPVFPRMEVVDPNGNQTWYDLGPYSPGSKWVIRPDSVRRKKPHDLSSSDAMTGWGGHNRLEVSRKPLPVFSRSLYGYQYTYYDIDPSSYATTGFTLTPHDPEWQVALRLAIKDQKVNLAQSLAEYKQTQRMFADNAETVVKVLRSLKRGDVRHAFEHLKLPPKQIRGTIANRWLELQYGWMPLLSDLKGATEELQTNLQRTRTRAISVRKVASDRQSIPNYNDHNGKKTFVDESWKVVVKVKAYLRQESLAACRLGLTNPVNLAWELLPYSFVIDWFIPIGDWLNSLDAGIGFNQIYGTVTTKTLHTATNEYGSQRQHQEQYGRSVFFDLPNAPLPTWNPSASWKRTANALSLLSQLKRELPESRIESYRKHYGSGRFFNTI